MKNVGSRGEFKYDHSKPKDIADLDDKVSETKKKLDILEIRVNKYDAGSLAKEVDRKVEAFEKRLEKLAKVIEEKDLAIVTLEKRVMKLETQNTENKKKLKDFENVVKKIQKNNDQVKDKLTKIDKIKQKKFNCTECEYSTSSHQGLKIHQRKKHTSVGTSDLPIKYDLCEIELCN